MTVEELARREDLAPLTRLVDAVWHVPGAPLTPELFVALVHTGNPVLGAGPSAALRPPEGR